MSLSNYFAERSPELPCTLALGANDPVILQKWLRVLPNQRYVAAALWDDKPVLVKVFVGKKAKKHYQRELEGIEALSSQEIPSAKLLHHCLLEEQLYLVVLEWLEGDSLLDVWHDNSRAELNSSKLDVLRQALKLTTLMHSRGLYQQDLHLDNFILTEFGLKAIDAGGVKTQHLSKPLSANLVQENLAVLLAQLSREIDSHIAELLTDDLFVNLNINMLMRVVNVKRRWRAKDILRKTCRNCSLFFYQKTKDKMISVERQQYAVLQALIDDIDAFMRRGHLYKTGGAATVVRLDYQGKNYIVKRNNIKNVSHCLKRFWRKSRAWHSYQMAFLLEMLEVPTSKALAAIEKRCYFARKQAWLITEYSGEEHLYAAFEPYIESGNVPVHLLDSLKSLFNSMIAAKISHGDLKAYNIFWHNQRFELIDLDSVRWHRCSKQFVKAFRKDRARLLRNWPETSPLHKRLDQELPKL